MSDIDREVAERIMGWSVGPMLDKEWCWYDKKGPRRSFEWSPSTNIEHAWEVLEHLGADGVAIINDDEGFWTVAWDGMQNFRSIDKEFSTSFWFDENTVWCETAPMAICKAALHSCS